MAFANHGLESPRFKFSHLSMEIHSITQPNLPHWVVVMQKTGGGHTMHNAACAAKGKEGYEQWCAKKRITVGSVGSIATTRLQVTKQLTGTLGFVAQNYCSQNS